MSNPLSKKLGIKEGYSLVLHNQPKDYWMYFDLLPDNLKQLDAEEAVHETIDFVHAFCTTQLDLNVFRDELKPLIHEKGMIWISWPKKTSSLSSEISRDQIREFGLSIGLVDVKVASINEDWSGVKFVYRLKDRKS